ncbi:uncharacterized protein JCM10292_005073 [Rhodotorula paludigena]|uniref:uncharacterized protein n=1 Tax=Rhodotorula paludigena TaxID=86838 RepID=UPI00317336CA
MRHSCVKVALVASLVAAVRAGGIIDNAIEAAEILASASTLSGAGNYVFTNVKTGQQLSFSRSSDTTDFYPVDADEGEALAVQFFGSAARLSGGNNKCASAQWDADTDGGVDHAAVSYACTVGTGVLSGTSTLEKTKQWWYILPADDSTSSASTDSSSTSTTPTATPSSTASFADNFVLAAVAASSSASRAAASSSAAPVAASSSSATSVSAAQASYDKLGYWTTTSTTIDVSLADTSSVVPQDQSTWVCRHPGWWLDAHPDYVTQAGHVECASDLAAYRADHDSASKKMRRVRRDRHHAEVARSMGRRSAQTYHIIAVDHLSDMSTRAIAHESVTTAGGYISTKLSLWDKTDQGQLWTITAA